MADQWADVASEAPAQTADPWSAVASPVANTAPQMPDTSGLQKTVNDNISAKQSNNTQSVQQQTPEQKLNDGLGYNTLGPYKAGTLLPQPVREHINNCYANGTASTAADCMQSTIPQIAAETTATPLGTALRTAALAQPSNVAGLAGFVAGGSAIAPVAAAAGAVFPPAAEFTIPTVELIGGFAGATAGSAAVEKGVKSLLDEFPEVANKLGVGKQQLIADARNPNSQFWGGLLSNLPYFSPALASKAKMLVNGAIGAAQEAGREWSDDEKLSLGKILSSAGVMAVSNKETVAGSAITSRAAALSENIANKYNSIRKPIADKLNIPASQVTNEQVDNVIAAAHPAESHPSAEDFTNTATVIFGKDGANSGADLLRKINTETGVRPEQVHADMALNPEVAKDISAGIVPKAYDNFRDKQTSVTDISSTTSTAVDHSQHTPEEFRSFAQEGKYPSTLEGAELAAKDFILDKGQQTNNEHMISSGDDGLATHYIAGDHDSLTLPDDLFYKLYDKNNNINLQHNHPDPTAGLSPDDISFLGMLGTHKITAYTPEGMESSASLTQEMKDAINNKNIHPLDNKRALNNISVNTFNHIHDIIQKLVNDGDIDGGDVGSDISKAHTEIFNKAMEKAGIIKYKSSIPINGMKGLENDIINQGADIAKQQLTENGYEVKNASTKGISEGGHSNTSNAMGEGGGGREIPSGRSAEEAGLRSENTNGGVAEGGGEEIKSPEEAVQASKQSSGFVADAVNSVKDFSAAAKREILNFATPMETGNVESQAAAKDFANNVRLAQYNGNRLFKYLTDKYTTEQLSKMWNAMDEASVHAQTLEASGMSRADALAQTEKDKVGHYALPKDQQDIIKAMSDHARTSWDAAKKLGMVEGEGLPLWTPRMAAVIGEDGTWQSPNNKEGKPTVNVGRNLSTTSGNLKGRSYLTAEETEAAMKNLFGENNTSLVRDIRSMPLAMSRIDQAIAGRTLIEQIKQMGTSLGGETVKDSPGEGYFTIDHPAFSKYEPRLKMGEDGKWDQVKDENGNPVFDKKPIYISKEFEGPLKAVLSGDTGEIYKAMMALKGKSMGLIMYSPLIHNMVEWGRALPTMPGKVITGKIYFEGNAVKNDPGQMQEFIKGGLVPIGNRFFNQDISSIMETPDLIAGRSWTAKLLGGLTGAVNENAGLKVKQTVDKLGDIWHNKLLWDRIADLQAGIAANVRDDLISKGMDRQAAVASAAHIANRFAGALPMESMGKQARKIANIALFSRSFTIGNLGVMKDMLAGMPSDVKSQLIRDLGESEAAKASSAVQKKALAAFAMDIALTYAGNSILQDTMDYLKRDKTLGQIAQGYAGRFSKLLSDHSQTPWDLLNLPADMQALSSTSTNEPGKENRIKFSEDPKTGTAYYMRMPTGKIGEEFQGWLTSPLDMLRKKSSTIVGPAMDIYKNADYFGHPIYDANAKGLSGAAENLGKVVKHLMEAQIPEESIVSSYRALTGSKEKSLDIMKSVGPLLGITFSKGYPGGPEAGILAEASRRHQSEVEASLPNIKSAVEDGNIDKAKKIMNDLKIPTWNQSSLIKHYQNPAGKVNARSLSKFESIATPEEKELMEEQQNQQP